MHKHTAFICLINVLLLLFMGNSHAKGNLRILDKICDDSTRACFNSCPACPNIIQCSHIYILTI